MDGKLRNMAAVYILYENNILLLYRRGGRVVNNVWTASAGGHFESFELNDAKACAVRELQEELGMPESALSTMRMRYITLRRTKGEIRQNYYFFAELKEYDGAPLESNEGILKWFPISEIRELRMPFTAKFVLEHYFDTGASTDHLYVGSADGVKVLFSELPEF